MFLTSETFIARAADADPRAVPEAAVVSGDARFTVLTPRVIRMEWSPSGRFEDRASYVFVNRRLEVPPYKVKREDGWLKIDTGTLTLRYREGSGKFGPGNLEVSFAAGERDVAWNPGTPNEENLLGTYRTLDGISGATDLEPGVLSRAGWTLIDDSSSLLFGAGDPPWATPRPDDEALDWYLFVYGRDYPQGLRDFTALAGKIPLPPRWVFGAWWSRYWAYSDAELRQLVLEFREHDVPLDVLVVDMDWHLAGWTGYTWNSEYFSDPSGFLRWAHSEGLKVPLNLHPHEGVGKQEARFKDFAERLGVDPNGVERIPFDVANPEFMRAYFEILLRPLEQQGIDFWWMDWQQGTTSAIPGLDPLPWLNYLHWMDWLSNPAKQSLRPLIFSRWGGLGSHRYPIGFSGDTFCNWRSLAFQPYFTATAGNVGFGYWSHDIGGHQPGQVDPELYTRWIQWGALSPVLRTHTTKNPAAERRIWEFPAPYYEAMKGAWKLRYSLLPYIYTMSRKTYDESLSLCRPLYWSWPDRSEAYDHPEAYLFGDDLYVAPIAQPADPSIGAAASRVWLPPGVWTHWFTGRRYMGPATIDLLTPLDEIPLFVRAGGIVPTTSVGRNSGAPENDPLVLNVFPGAEIVGGETRVYEDDGVGRDYETGDFCFTPVRCQRNGGEFSITIGPSDGPFARRIGKRHYELRLHNVPPARQVTLNGELLPRSTGGSASWWYDAETMSVAIRSPQVDVTAPLALKVLVHQSSDVEALLRQGLRGYFRLVERFSDQLHGKAPEAFEKLLAIRAKLDVDAAAAVDELAKLELRPIDLAKAVAELDIDPQLKQNCIAQLLGVVAKLDVAAIPGADAPLRASAAVALNPILGEATGLRRSLRFEPPTNWQTSHGAAGPSEIRGDEGTLSLSADFVNPGPLQTATLRAVVTVRSGTTQIELPFERTVFPSIGAWWVAAPLDPAKTAELDAQMSKLSRVDPNQPLPGLNGMDVTWQYVARTIQPGDDVTDEFFINFRQLHPERYYNTTGYAVAFIESPEDMPAQIALGSDDGVVAWLNGEEVHRNLVGRAYTPRQDQFPVSLKRGVNTLVLRIDQQGGDWAFGAHVETRDGKPLTNVMILRQPDDAFKDAGH